MHFNQFSEGQGRFGRRLIYGGHVISLARALSFNGLANAFHIAAINGGRHVAPLFAGATLFAWSEVVETAALPEWQYERLITPRTRLLTIPLANPATGWEPAARTIAPRGRSTSSGVTVTRGRAPAASIAAETVLLRFNLYKLSRVAATIVRFPAA